MLFFQLKKMSNTKPVAESSAASETLEEVVKPSEGTMENGSDEEAQENVQPSSSKGVGARKENKVVKKNITENGKKETQSPPPKRQKRKFPSRDEISKAR